MIEPSSTPDYRQHVAVAALWALAISFSHALPAAEPADRAAAASVKVFVDVPHPKPDLKKVFELFEGVQTTFQGRNEWAAMPVEVRDGYDVVIFMSCHWKLTNDKTKEALEHLGSTRQGIILVHQALVDYYKWPVWHDIVGTADREGCGHAGNQKFRVDVANPEHPITEGLASYEFVDETCLKPQPGEGCVTLLTTEHRLSGRAIAWAQQYKQSRVFCFQSGHDAQAWSNPNFSEVLRRGILWCAHKVPGAPRAGRTFNVSPKGSDVYPGTPEKPFAVPDKAQAKVRAAAENPAPNPLPTPQAAAGRLAFEADAKGGFDFRTPLLTGKLRSGGKSLGLLPLAAADTRENIAGKFGLFSLYRIFSANTRYGNATWDRRSTATLLPDGSVQLRWPAESGFPFELSAEYAWAAAGTLDLKVTVKAEQELPRFEVYLASYFQGFPESLVYVRENPEAAGNPGFLPARKEAGGWQFFPRDADAAAMVADGRWKHPPYPVNWKRMPPLAAPLAMRRDAQHGWTAVLMAPAGDCFGVSTPHGEEGHRSLYLSLFGRDVKSGQTDSTRARLVVGRKISEAQAVELYESYVKTGG
jgi:type 1 glutamine amidotransferase